MFRRSDEVDFNFNKINNHVLMQNNQFIVDRYSSQTQDLYFHIIESAQSLQNCHEKQLQLNICKQITSNCERLAKKINNIIQEIIPLEKEIQDLLINTEKKSAEITKKMNQFSESMRELDTKKAGIEQRQKEISKDIKDLEENIKKNKEEINKKNNEQSRSELIVGGMFGAFGGVELLNLISSNKNLEIKLAYNQGILNGLIKDQKHIDDDLLLLNQELKKVEFELHNIRGVRNDVDKKIKEIGKDLTNLRNIGVSLGKVFNNYKFVVIKDVELIEDQVLEEILEPKEISNFIESIKKIQSIKISES